MALAANSIEGKAKALADRIEVLQKAIEFEQAMCSEECAPHRESIKEIWTEAKAAGLPLKAMRAYVRVRTAQRKAVAKLEPDERASYEALREAMGPLGAAAAEKAGFAEAAP